MRKIEQNMLTAIHNRRNWKENNTCVEFSDHVGNPFMDATVYLHGNPIAYLLPDGSIEPDCDTLGEWPTPTTKSRLRALGVDLTQTKGKIYIDGEFICMV